MNENENIPVDTEDTGERQAVAPAIVIEEKVTPSTIEEKVNPTIVIEDNIVPPSRGRRSAVPTMYTLEVGQCMVCPPGIPKRPHQTVYYHNALAKKNGSGKVWGVSCRNGVYRIHRLK